MMHQAGFVATVLGDQVTPTGKAHASASQPILDLRDVTARSVNRILGNKDGLIIAGKQIGERYPGYHQHLESKWV